MAPKSRSELPARLIRGPSEVKIDRFSRHTKPLPRVFPKDHIPVLILVATVSKNVFSVPIETPNLMNRVHPNRLIGLNEPPSVVVIVENDTIVIVGVQKRLRLEILE